RKSRFRLAHGGEEAQTAHHTCAVARHAPGMPTESVKTGDIRRVSQTRDLEAALTRLANRQHGVVGRTQLEGLGLGEDAIRHRQRLGRLHRLHRGAFAVGHRVLSRQGWWMAAVLASGPEAVLSHQTAAALWGLRGYSGG